MDSYPLNYFGGIMALLKSMKTHETSGEKFLKEMKVKLDNMSDDEFNERFNAVCDDTDTGRDPDRFEITPNISHPWSAMAPTYKINFLESEPNSLSYAYEGPISYQVRYSRDPYFGSNASLLNHSDAYHTKDTYYIHIGDVAASGFFDPKGITLKFFTSVNGKSQLYASSVGAGGASAALITDITPMKIDALIRVLQTMRTTI